MKYSECRGLPPIMPRQSSERRSSCGREAGIRQELGTLSRYLEPLKPGDGAERPASEPTQSDGTKRSRAETALAYGEDRITSYKIYFLLLFF